MKFVLISDLHLMSSSPVSRLDDAQKTSLDKLAFVLNYAESKNAVILQAGDFFDGPRSWYLLPKVLSLIGNFHSSIHAIFGQHDTYMYSVERRRYTSLGVLEAVGDVNILNDHPFCFSDLHVYGCSYGEEIPNPHKILMKNRFKNVLVIHAPIAEKEIFPGQEYESYNKFLMEQEHYDVILCGDIHRAFFYERRDGRIILNTGSMMRKTAEKYSFEHEPHFYVWDSESGDFEKVIIPHSPAEEVLTRAHIEDSEEKKAILGEFVDAIKDDYEAQVDFMETLLSLAKVADIDEHVFKIMEEIIESCKKDG